MTTTMHSCAKTRNAHTAGQITLTALCEISEVAQSRPIISQQSVRQLSAHFGLGS